MRSSLIILCLGGLALGCEQPRPSFPSGPVDALLVRNSACLRGWISLGHTEYVMANPRDQQFDCAGVTSCAAFDACLGVDTESICSHTFEPTCDGDEVVHCLHDRIARFDCSTRGPNTTCIPELAECATRTACERSRCEDGARIYCRAGFEREGGCPEGAAICVETAEGAGCVTRAGPCEVDRCAGDVLERCVDGGVVSTDCRDLYADSVCDDSTGEARCTPAEDVCAHGALECLGDVARVCFEGAWVEYDCREVGARCIEDADQDILRCTLGPAARR